MPSSTPPDSVSQHSAPSAWRPGSAHALIAAAFLVPLLFAWITDHVWEDFYITFRSSRNFAEGHGLVFQVGERVHTFTSPLGVLVPAWFASMTDSDVTVIWLFRVFNAALLAITIHLWRGIAVRHLPGFLGRMTLLGLFLADAKIVAYSMNGMETAMLLLFLTLGVRALIEELPRPWAVATAFAGLMWSRPDGFVFFGAMVMGAGVFLAPRRSWLPAWTWLKPLMIGLLLGGLLYAPWIAWAWSYYGSPIPNTIIAKTEWFSRTQVFFQLLTYPMRVPFGLTHSTILFEPIYCTLGGWPDTLRLFSKMLGASAALYFIVPGANRIGRALSLAAFLGGLYLELTPPTPWYHQVWQLYSIAAFAFLIEDLRHFARWLNDRWPVTARAYLSATRIVVLSVLTIQIGILAATTVEFREHQRIVQDGVRKQVGLWLRAEAQAGDRVYLEPLGYIGYFSGLKMLDYPGLSAPEMTAELDRRPGNFTRAIPAFWPEWLVLRPNEVKAVDPATMKHYEQVKTFDRRAEIETLSIPGRGYLMYDAAFVIFRRVSQPG